jgi:hypothetical protein
MAGWARAGENRWAYAQDEGDGSSNYLQRDGEQLREMHVSGNTATIHEYRLPEGAQIEDDNPLEGAVWIRSTPRTLPAAIGQAEAWQLLGETDR